MKDLTKNIVLLAIIILSFYSCELFNSNFKKNNFETREYTKVIDTYPKDSFESEGALYCDTDIEIKVIFNKQIDERSVNQYSLIVVPIKEFDSSNKDSLTIDSIVNLRKSEDYNLIADEIDNIIEDSMKTSPQLVDKYVEGDVLLQDDKKTITFKPNNELMNKRLFLILINKIYDEDFYPVYPYIGIFETLPNYDNDLGENNIGVNTETDGEKIDELPLPAIGELIINEILYDPPDDLNGDANQDGTRDSYDDEFIEIVNKSDHEISLENISVAVGDATNIRNTFSAGTTLPAGKPLVLFSGGDVGNLINSCIIQLSENSLKLSNSGSTIFILNGDEIIDSVNYQKGSGDNQAIGRNPDITGDFVGYKSIIEANGALFSVCTKVDGSYF